MRLVKSSRQAQRREATRRRIVEAATAVFARQGLAAPIDAVCREAGCSKGAFYYHFRGRSQLDALLASDLAPKLTGGAALATGKQHKVSALVVQLWAKGGRCKQVRRPVAAAIRGLSVFPEGEQTDLVAEIDQTSIARLCRLLVLGRLAQAQWWTRIETGDANAGREAASTRRARGLAKQGDVWKLASGR